MAAVLHLGLGMADHPRLAFDAPNVKLHVDRVYILQDIAIFILPIHSPITPNEFQYCRNPQKDRPWVKTRRMSHKP